MKKYNSIKEFYDENDHFKNVLTTCKSRLSLVHSMLYTAIAFSDHSFVEKLKEGWVIDLRIHRDYVIIEVCKNRKDIICRFSSTMIFFDYRKIASNYCERDVYVTKIFNQIDDLIDQVIDYVKIFEMSDDYGKVKANTCRTESL